MSRRLAVLLAASTLLALTAAPASADLGFRSTFGSDGTGNGQFRWLNGIGVDGSDRIYATDCSLNRVEIFNPDGTFHSQLGGPYTGGPAPSGSGPGQFNCPTGVATQGDDYVYVADLNNLRVQRFAGWSGNVPLDYIQSFVLRGTDKQPCAPYGVAVAPSGDVWVAGGPSRDECMIIGKFSRNGVPLLSFGSRGAGNGQFGLYMYLATDAAGNLYVSDGSNNNRVQKFDANGSFLSAFGSLGTGDGQFYGPAGLDVDAAGNIWVADGGINRRIQQFTSNGLFAAAFGGQGTGPGQFTLAIDVEVDSNCNVYAVDGSGVGEGIERIQRFGQSEAPFCRPAAAASPGPGGTAPGGDDGRLDAADPPTPPDKASPSVTVTATASSFDARRGLLVPIRVNEDSAIGATGKINVPDGLSRVYSVSARRASGRKGRTLRLRLKGTKKTNRAIATALKRGAKLRAKVTITARDKAGNVTRERATLKLR